MQAAIAACRVLQTSSVTYEKRGTSEGLIRGELFFVDGSVLHFREVVDVEVTADRLMYTYHYMTATKTLIFRYDNTGHHRKLSLPTYPHHKHVENEGNVIAAPACDLLTVLREVASVVQLSE